MNNESNIEDEILAYLAENPNARDTVDGVTEWWIANQMVSRTAANVQAALARLVARGLLVARTGQDGNRHYNRNN